MRGGYYWTSKNYKTGADESGVGTLSEAKAAAELAHERLGRGAVTRIFGQRGAALSLRPGRRAQLVWDRE